MTIYYAGAPRNVPLPTVTAVANADGKTYTIIAGAAALAAAEVLGRSVTINVVAGSDTSVSAAACDVPNMTGTPTAAQIAAVVLADTVRKGSGLSPGDVDGPNYIAESNGSFSLFKTEANNVVRRVHSLQA
jgi:hypothetical protein